MKKACFISVAVVILAGLCFAQSVRPVEVVAEASLTNQIQGNQRRFLYTPKETGMFRVTFYVQCIKGDPQNGQGLSPQLYFTDDTGRDFFSGHAPDNVPQPPTSYIFVIKSIGGSSISWEVAKQGSDESAYEVYLALERIGPVAQ
jgi:hypothetical protein